MGDIVAGRFVLELEAGRGGMGTVFRARDRDGTEVALKLIRAEPSARERALFAREAAALAAQTHAGVVRYLAHGVDAGVPWLAMEWVSGTTLSRRLATGPALSAREVLLLWRRLSRALAAVHAAGIVHRDVKPGNVMLPGGDVLAAKLTDFGVARSTTGAIDALTQTGDVVGTISFMAPEQLMGAREIGAPVDVFALGRLIYECVLGRPAFGGQLPAAVMLRIASEAPAELAEVGRRIGLGAGELLEAMLAKAPLLRPRMAEVSDRLERLIEDGTQRLGDDPISSVTRRERRLDCLVLARIDTTSTEVEVTLDARAPSGLERARRAIDAHGGHGQVLGGTLVSATFDEAESLTERAARAAATALGIKHAVPSSPVVVCLATIQQGELSTEPVIDRAVSMLVAEPAGARGARIDEGAASLLEGRFELEGSDGELRVVARAHPSLVPTVPRRATPRARAAPFLGRDKELRQLGALLAPLGSEVVEAQAAAVVVIGPAGLGKTRLVAEALAGVPEHALLLRASGDALAPGAPLAMLGQLVRGFAGVRAHDPLPIRRAALASRLSEGLEARDLARVVAFLADVSGVSDERGSEPADALVRAARLDPSLLADQLRRAFVEAILATLRARPVAIAIDDLQWGDLPSLRILEATLGRAAELPLAIVATARPEIPAALLASLGPERTELHLAPLPARASSRLAELALGGHAPEVRHRLVDLAAGNPFYLEELIRGVEAGGASLPTSVLAAAQGRLASLPADARRTLRAASVFGRRFEPAGVEVLTGDPQTSLALALLESEDLVAREDDGAYAFRHALAREAAYAMLAPDDLAMAHRAAARWLESRSGADPLVLAWHHERAGESERAVEPLLAATRAAAAASDHGAVAELVARVLPRATSAIAGELLVLSANARRALGDDAGASHDADRALELLTPGSVSWFQAAAELVVTSVRAGLPEPRERGLRALEMPADDDSRAAFVQASGGIAGELFNTDATRARAVLSRAERAALALTDAFALGRLAHARGMGATLSGDLERALEAYEDAWACYTRLDDARRLLPTGINIGHVYTELGLFAQAEHYLGRALTISLELGEPLRAQHARINLGRVLGLRGEHARAIELLSQTAAEVSRRGNKLYGFFAHLYLAESLLAADDPSAAGEALARAPVFPGLEGMPHRTWALALEAEVLRRAGALGEAAARSRDAVARAGGPRSSVPGAVRAALELVRSLEASGLRAEALELARQTASALDERAALVSDPARRAAYLDAVPDHRTIRALALALAA